MSDFYQCDHCGKVFWPDPEADDDIFASGLICGDVAADAGQVVGVACPLVAGCCLGGDEYRLDDHE